MAEAAESGSCPRSGEGSTPGNQGQSRQREFLPALLAIQETPPSPLGRRVLWTLFGLIAAALLWASIGRVDIVVVAPGRVVPLGQVKVVQAPAAGRVSALHVRQGQVVGQGDPLLSLDDTVDDVALQQLRQQLSSLRLEQAWRRSMSGQLSSGALDCAVLEAAQAGREDAAWPEEARSQCAQLAGELAAIDSERRRNGAERLTMEADLARTERSLEILEERVEAYRTLHRQQYGSKVAYLELQQEETHLAGSLPVLQAQLLGIRAQDEILEGKRRRLLHNFQRENAFRLRELEDMQGNLEQDLRKRIHLQVQQTVVAPVGGVVESLSVHTLGAVVTPAQQLLKIVPGNAEPRVELQLRNQDIGFLREGQAATIKVDAIDAARYGSLEAIVKNISEDAVSDPQRGWVFPATLELAAGHIQVGPRAVALRPGMTVQAEIITGERRLIDFFLSPLREAVGTSLRER